MAFICEPRRTAKSAGPRCPLAVFLLFLDARGEWFLHGNMPCHARLTRAASAVLWCCPCRPERLNWSLQRLVRTFRRADQNNLEMVADKAVESEAKGADGLPLENRQLWEQDAMAAISLEIFFPGALKGVDGADKVSAGDRLYRSSSSS